MLMLVYIQVLRFLAAFAVVAFHAWGVAPEGYKVPDNFVSFVLSWGGRGVDLFFVISGFIIFYATHRANQDAREFLQKLSNTTAGRFYESKASKFKDVFELVVEELRQQFSGETVISRCVAMGPSRRRNSALSAE